MRSEIATLASQVREHALAGASTLNKTVEKIMTLFDDAYQPEVIEKQARLVSTIEREIDRSIKRLIFLKTFKSETMAPRIDVPVLASPPMTPSQTPRKSQADGGRFTEGSQDIPDRPCSSRTSREA